MSTLEEQSKAFQFYQAAMHGDASTVGCLLAEHPSLVNLRIDGNTPLSKAAFYGHPEVVKVLLDSGASPGGTDKDGDRAVDLAVLGMRRKPNEGIAITRELISRGQIPSAKFVQTSFCTVVEEGMIGAADYLASLGLPLQQWQIEAYRMMKERSANASQRAKAIGGSGCLSGTIAVLVLSALAYGGYCAFR